MLQNELGRTFINVVSLKDELKHGEWEEHKYVAKVPVGNGKYRYFYDKKEYQDYVKIQTEQPAVMNGVKEVITDILDTHGKYMEGLNDPKTFSELNKKTAIGYGDIRDLLEDTSIVNLGRYATDNTKAYTYNCAYCTAAYDMRRRGYEVVSDAKMPMLDDLTYASELASWYEGSVIHTGRNEDKTFYSKQGADCELNNNLSLLNNKLEEADNPFDSLMARLNLIDAEMMLTNELLQYGEGARGFMGIEYDNGGRHSIAWEICDGKLYLLDAQVNQVYTSERGYYIEKSSLKSKELSGIQVLLSNVKTIDYFRTDNLEPNKDILKVIKNRK